MSRCELCIAEMEKMNILKPWQARVVRELVKQGAEEAPRVVHALVAVAIAVCDSHNPDYFNGKDFGCDARDCLFEDISELVAIAHGLCSTK